MFFYIGKTNLYFLNKVHDNLYLDEGWCHNNNLWYKGYSTECLISENLKQITNGFTPNGIWCVIEFINGTYNLYHSHLRGFPLYYKNEEITNIKLENFIQEDKWLDYHLYQNTYDEVIVNIKNILYENCLYFYRNYKSKFNIWCTGGIDSVSIIAICEAAKIPYKIYVAKPKTFNGNLREFESSILEYTNDFVDKIQKDYWGYEILSYFKDYKNLVTGFYGDEFCCRNPYQLNLLANIENKSILSFLNPKHYMFEYIRRTHKKELLKSKLLLETQSKIAIKAGLGLDFQIWHINNSTTFCPYYDERIIDNILGLPYNVIIEKTLNADIQKDVVKLINPNFLNLLDDFKNTENGRKNFIKNYKNISFQYCEEIEEV